MAERSVSIALEARVSSFVANIKTAQRAVSSFQADLEKTAKKRQALDQLGSTAGKIGLVAAAGLGAAVAAAANFDAAMSQVQAATGETATNMERLRTAALDAGQRTAYSATEAAAGIEALAKAGVSTEAILNGGLDGALDLAAAGNIEVADAAEAASKAMTQFGLAGSDVPHIADLLAAAAGKATGDVGDFTQALNQSGLVADQVGLSIEETTGGLAAFASAGLLGSDAGTSFKQALAALTPNSAKAAKAMDELGINAYDAQGNFIGLAEFAGNLQGALKDMSAEQRTAALETIFGSDAVRAASVLYEQGEAGIRKWTRAVDDQGYAAETAATRLDNLKGDIEALGGALETALIGTGDGAQGPLRELTQGVTGVVNAYNELPSSAQNATGALLGLTALLGGGIWVGSKALRGIADTRQAMADLGIQAGRTRQAMSWLGKGLAVGLAIEGINLLDAALDELTNRDLNTSTLGRSLTALAGGTVAGTIRDAWGEDLGKMNFDLDQLDNNIARVQDSWDLIFPGDLTPVEQAKTNFERLDEALAGLVEGGNGDQAAAIFDQLAAKAAEGGNTAEQLMDQLEQYGIALRNAGTASGEVGGLVGMVGDALSGILPDLNAATGATEENTNSVRENAQALLDQRNARLANQNAVIGWHQSIADADQAVKDNGRTLDITTAKGRANRTALLNLAGAWNQQSLAVRSNRANQRQAIATFVQVATQMGMNERQAREYAKSLYAIPERRDTKLNVNLGNSLVLTRQLAAEIDRVRSKTVFINVRRIGGNAPMLDSPRKAAGGPIVGPGTGTSDDVPIWASNGEHMWTAREVANAGGHAEVERIRAQFRYAEGGGVGDPQRGRRRSVDERRKDEKRDEDRREKDRKKREDERERRQQKHRERVQRGLERQVKQLDKVIDNTKQLQQTVAGNFTTDPFESNATLQGVLASLGADTGNADAFRAAARQAKRLGLDGGVFRALLASGNTAVLTDLDSRADVRRLEAAWAARNKATANLTFGAASDGRTMADMRGTLKELNQRLKRLEKLDERVERGSERGTRKGTDKTRKRDGQKRRQAARGGNRP